MTRKIKGVWEKFYKTTPLDKIPWLFTQADYFVETIDSGKVKPGTALDLGCGTGSKSIYLAKKSFKVTGIDISETAIKYARENARKEKVKINFTVGDATKLDSLFSSQFDFILDWANLHGIPKSKRQKYVKTIARHCKKGGKFLLRCFSKYEVPPQELGFLTPMGIIYLFSKEDIKGLFGKYFNILETNRSKPKTNVNKWFDEYLMEMV